MKAMELVVKQLIFHEYDLTEFKRNWSPYELKNANMEWNEKEYKSHPYIKDINENDIAISVRWHEKNEDYAYFFFKEQSIEGGTLYTFTKSVIDKEMPMEILEPIIGSVITQLNNGNYSDNDRLKYNEYPYPLAKHHLQDTIASISEKIIKRFVAEITGFAPLPDSFLRKLGK